MKFITLILSIMLMGETLYAQTAGRLSYRANAEYSTLIFAAIKDNLLAQRLLETLVDAGTVEEVVNPWIEPGTSFKGENISVSKTKYAYTFTLALGKESTVVIENGFARFGGPVAEMFFESFRNQAEKAFIAEHNLFPGMHYVLRTNPEEYLSFISSTIQCGPISEQSFCEVTLN